MITPEQLAQLQAQQQQPQQLPPSQDPMVQMPPDQVAPQASPDQIGAIPGLRRIQDENLKFPEQPPPPPAPPQEMVGPDGQFAPNPMAQQAQQADPSLEPRETLDEAVYGWADACGTCKYMILPESCAVVVGHINVLGTCENFEVIDKVPQDASQGFG